MRAGLAVAWGLIACRQSLPASHEPGGVDVVAARPVPGSFGVVAAELGDDGVVDRMRHRVRWRRIGRASLRPGGTSITEDGRKHDTGKDELDLVLPVLGETAAAIRIVVEEDDARIAAWIDRGDAWPTVVAPIRLEARDGRVVERDAGVWLDPGAPIEIERAPEEPQARSARINSGDHEPPRRAIRMRDEAVRVEGWVPGAVVAQVWLVDRGDHSETDMHQGNMIRGWYPPPETRPKRRIGAGTPIRAAASTTAPLLAIVRSADLDVAVIGRGGEWTEIELLRPFARIRGHVLTDALSEPDGVLHGFGSTGGHGFGMSHADRIDVPKGTCLYDRIDGEVIGVSIKTMVRLGRLHRGEAWSMVYVDTPWAIASLYVRETSRDPARPAWESCTSAVHRR